MDVTCKLQVKTRLSLKAFRQLRAALASPTGCSVVKSSRHGQLNNDLGCSSHSAHSDYNISQRGECHEMIERDKYYKLCVQME